MSKENMHQALSDYVQQQIASGESSLSAAEWVTMMNCYARHDSPQYCAEKLKMNVIEVKRIYYQLTLYAADYALNHINEDNPQNTRR